MDLNESISDITTSSDSLSSIDKKIYPFLTLFMHFFYEGKMIINIVIGALLGYLLVTSITNGETDLQRAYISLTIIIIISLFSDRYIRNKSRLFNLSTRLNDPIVIIPGTLIIVYYNRLEHIVLLTCLLSIEFIKILAGIFCIIDLHLLSLSPAYLNHVLLSLLLFESLIGYITYVIAIFFVIINKNSYIKWLNYLAERFIRKSCKCEFIHLNNRIYVKFSTYDKLD